MTIPKSQESERDEEVGLETIQPPGSESSSSALHRRRLINPSTTQGGGDSQDALGSYCGQQHHGNNVPTAPLGQAQCQGDLREAPMYLANSRCSIKMC